MIFFIILMHYAVKLSHELKELNNDFVLTCPALQWKNPSNTVHVKVKKKSSIFHGIIQGHFVRKQSISISRLHFV